jgi:hypothetical protein
MLSNVRRTGSRVRNGRAKQPHRSVNNHGCRSVPDRSFVGRAKNILLIALSHFVFALNHDSSRISARR